MDYLVLREEQTKLTSVEIEKFKSNLREYVEEIQFSDEILARLYHRILEQVCNDLSTLWFYHDALRSRKDK
jgi:hypothetical protein